MRAVLPVQSAFPAITNDGYIEVVLARHVLKLGIFAYFAKSIIVPELQKWANVYLNRIVYTGSMAKGTGISGTTDLDMFISVILRTHWVLVVMDQCTRRIVGFGVQRGAVDSAALCRMFNRVMRGHSRPTYLSSDHDRLYEFHRWQANLRILDVARIKTVPYAPLAHPFVERLIGTIRRECLDRTLFWTTADLEMKLLELQRYYNGYRAHAGLDGSPPASIPDEGGARASLRSYRWQRHCRGLYHTPLAA